MRHTRMDLVHHRRAVRSGPGAAGLLAAALLLALGGCGGGDSGSTTAPAGKANIVVTFANAVWTVAPRSTGKKFELDFDLTAQETAGVGAHPNFIRGEFFDDTGRAPEIAEFHGPKLNRLEANGTLQQRLGFVFNRGTSTHAVVTINFTDDRGNDLEISFRVNCC